MKTTYPSIQHQVAYRLIPTLLILWLLLGGITAKLVSEKTYDLLDSSLIETAERILPLALLDIQQRAKINADIELVPLPLNDENLSYQIHNQANKILLRSHKSPLDHLENLPQGFSEQHGMRIYGSSTEDGSYKIYVFEPISHRQETLHSLLLYFLVPFLLIVPISYVAIKQALLFLPNRLKEYSEELSAVTEGNLKPITLDQLPLELLGVGKSVNTLIYRLNEMLTSERSFSENIAHELRTPIAVAMAQLEVLNFNNNVTSSENRILKIKNSLINIELMINRFLQIARAESGFSHNHSQTSLIEISKLVVDQLKTKSDREYKINVIEPTQTVLIDPDALGIILMNLLENAHQYAPADTTIEIVVGSGAQLQIRNEHPKLDSSKLTQIMNRYQRGTQKGLGLGIGLSIVKLLVEQANGMLSFESPIPGKTDGVQVTVTWQ